MQNVISYQSGMASFAHEFKDYLAYTSKTVEEAIAHVAQGVVLGRGGAGFGKRREGLYGLTRALAFKSRDAIDKMFAKHKFNIKRRYSPPGSPLSGPGYGRGQSRLLGAGAGSAMYRAADPIKYRKQTKFMLAKDILISNRGDKLSTTPFTYVNKKEINYNVTESMRRYRFSRFLSVGWLPSTYIWKNSGGAKVKTELLQSNASKYGSIKIAGQGPAFSVTMTNNLPGFAVVDRKYGIIGRALANVADDMRDYLNRNFMLRRSYYKNITLSEVR